MSVGFSDDFVSALENIAEDLKLTEPAVFKAVHDALDQWTALTAVAAIQRLGRPHWLLSKSIANKVIDYVKDHKVHAMYGFRFRAGRKLNVKARTRGVYLPDPGYYGQYFEGGKRRGGVPYRTPDHFLRDAKKQTFPILGALLNKHFNAAMKEALQKELGRIKMARKDARRQGRRYDPEEGYPRQ